MKIIKQTIKQMQCTNCNAVLEIMFEDLRQDLCGDTYFKCPCCKTRRYLTEWQIRQFLREK